MCHISPTVHAYFFSVLKPRNVLKIFGSTDSLLKLNISNPDIYTYVAKKIVCHSKIVQQMKR